MFQYFNQTQPSTRYLFVSDIHGFDQNLNQLLQNIQSTPEIVFFLGDIVGTDLLSQLQKLFYNGIYNPMKKLLMENNKPNDIEILYFPIDEKTAIIDGCQQMRDFLMKLDPEYQPELCANLARTLSNFQHFGHFIGNLPYSIRTIIQKDMTKNALKNIQIMSYFADKGSKIIVIEGNWDIRTPLDFYFDCQVILPEHRDFNFKKLVSQTDNRIHYCDQVDIIETTDCIFILWPFDNAINHTPVPEISNPKNKKIVLISHAQVFWEPIKEKTPMTGEGQKINQYMPIVVEQLKADAVVHGHLHDQLRNGADGYLLPNWKYVHYLPIQTYRFIDF